MVSFSKIYVAKGCL